MNKYYLKFGTKDKVFQKNSGLVYSSEYLITIHIETFRNRISDQNDGQ